MLIEKLEIKNYKSIGEISIVNPSPFTVFVGANACGKSNIFEAIEYLYYSLKYNDQSFLELRRIFGGPYELRNKMDRDYPGIAWKINIVTPDSSEYEKDNKCVIRNIFRIEEKPITMPFVSKTYDVQTDEKYSSFFNRFSRIFINDDKEKISYRDEYRLSSSCRNLESVLKKILEDENKREELTDWLQLLIPGFDKISIHSDELSGTDNLLVYEQNNKIAYSKKLISNGTYNIIALLTAVFQSDEPQFLCIEEPENGLNPKVVKKLVSFFRQKCEENGHYIWLNTHSQTLVRELTNQEIILVDKIGGRTQIKQVQDKNLHGIPMDEALMTNMLGGGIPW
ncbi:MAG: ATP-binding protein [Bacteroidia bacterium]|jgi:predicted ATPase|nr:ATP-binding protein [Bacteroidia bacterium]